MSAAVAYNAMNIFYVISHDKAKVIVGDRIIKKTTEVMSSAQF